MFTGIIEEVGTVSNLKKQAKSLVMTIQASTVLEDVQLGDSIAINGVCLTVTSFTSNQFDVDVMPETFDSTSLKSLEVGSKVNLERAMAANGRFGGHFVSGHVDGVGTIIKRQMVENALYMTIQAPKACLPFFMLKGSVAIDGTSLTIFHVEEDTLTISLIPHTRGATILAEKKIGDQVNIECDMLAKYVQQMLQPVETEKDKESKITMDFLEANGFM